MPNRDDDFFVGYLPTPPSVRRWTLAAAACAVLILIASAIVIAARQRDPGNGQWELSDPRRIEGIYSDLPYPMLHTSEATILVVGEGKVAAPGAASLQSNRVRASGTLIRRGELTLFELNAPLESAGPAAALPDLPKPQSLRELRGEILDSKCFAGAMKPGDGKTHKACAALCLRGGIPPVFRSGNDLYLLVDQNLKPFDTAALQRVIDHVGDDVTVVGGVTSLGRLKVLAADAGSIRRRGRNHFVR